MLLLTLWQINKEEWRFSTGKGKSKAVDAQESKGGGGIEDPPAELRQVQIKRDLATELLSVPLEAALRT